MTGAGEGGKGKRESMINSEDIQFQFISSMSCRTQHHTMLRDNNLGIQCEQIANRTSCGTGVKSTKNFYFIDNDEREFTDLEKLVDAYNEKFVLDGEDPEYEVKFVRVRVKRDKANNPPILTQPPFAEEDI